MDIEKSLQSLHEGQKELTKQVGEVATTVGLIKQKCGDCSDRIKRHSIQLNGTGADGGLIAEVRALQATNHNTHSTHDSTKWYQTQLGKVIEKALYLVVVITGMAGAYLFGKTPEPAITPDTHLHQGPP